MCVNQIRYFNRHTHKFMYAKCGHCSSCQQEKAFARTKRIHNAKYPGYIPLFVTLTYMNYFIPYVRKDDIRRFINGLNGKPNGLSFLPVYRDRSCRKVRVSSDYKMRYKFSKETQEIARYTTDDCKEFYSLSSADVRALRKLRGQSDSKKVGVLFFKDLQDFEKRLRINLERHYNIKQPIYTFKCSEIGPSTQRPHFHLLVYVPKENLVQCQRAVSEAWPYDSQMRKLESISIARNAASYVSSYVNRGSDFPRFHTFSPFRPRHSFSKGFGTQDSQFTLPEIIRKIERGNLQYTSRRMRNHVESFADILLPKYVINRYFAKFLGFGRLNYDEVCELIQDPTRVYDASNAYLIDKLGAVKSDINSFTGDSEIDHDKIKALINHINLRYHRFITDFVGFEETISGDIIFTYGLPDNEYSRQLFADYYYRVWRVYSSNVYAFQFTDVMSQQDVLECYDNLDDIRQFGVRSDLLEWVKEDTITNPNLFRKTLIQTFNMSEIFHNTYKRRKITNEAMASNCLNV